MNEQRHLREPNLALVVLEALKLAKMPVDEESFQNVSRVAQVLPNGGGIIIKNIETLAMACERGGFNVVFTEEGLLQARMPSYIGTTQGMSGWFAVLYWWNPAHGGFYEPYTTGVGRYRTREPAVQEAVDWARAEGVEYRS